MQTLYHYCSSQTFLSILQSRTIRLSSLTSSNDSLEGKIVAHAIERLAARDELSSDAIEHIKKLMELFGSISDGLGFCLSEEGDILSQWRGYADDASGLSIGFSKDYIEWLSSKLKQTNEKKGSFSLLQVKYSEREHEDEVRPTYEKIKQLINDGALRIVYKGLLLETRSDEDIELERKEIQKKFNALTFQFMFLLPKLFALKSEAFREEKEWRLVANHVINYVDGGCEFRAIGRRIIPFVTHEMLTQTDAPQPIREVIIGPRNETPSWVVNDFLAVNGYSGVAVRRSTASYR